MTAIIWVLGCTNVSGKVDAYDTPVNTAVYVELDDGYGSDDGILVLVASHGLDCEEWADFEDDWNDALTDDLDFDDAEDVWRDALPGDFWLWQLAIRVDRLGDDLAGDDWDGVDWDEGVGEDDEAKITVQHYTRYPDADDWFTALEQASDTYFSDGGTLSIGGYKERKSIRGTFKTQMVDDDGSDEGDITLRFNADHCEDLEDEWNL